MAHTRKRCFTRPRRSTVAGRRSLRFRQLRIGPGAIPVPAVGRSPSGPAGGGGGLHLPGMLVGERRVHFSDNEPSDENHGLTLSQGGKMSGGSAPAIPG